jgi:serine/threonine protein kinase
VIGSVIDKYEVIRKLGEGGMATVYHARHLTLQRDVALKVMHPHLSSSELNRDRFAREARTIERLNHKAILKILDYSGVEGGNCYIVTELIDGLTLKEVLENEVSLPSELVASIAIHLTEALCYAHSFGIVHRDLKPENVMIRRDGQIKLMDFGIARILDEVHLTMTGNLVGSPAYMSPEQAQEKELNEASDWFSFGTLLFHLATGHLPYQGSNPSIVLKNIIDGERLSFLDICPEASIKLGQLIDKLHQPNIEVRLKDKDLIIEDLKRVFEEVNLSHQDNRWQIQSWLSAPKDYESKLKVHVIDALHNKGKEALEMGSHFEALQYLSRLLSIDENHPEANLLLDQMHQAQEDRRPLKLRRPRVKSRYFFGLLVLIAICTFTFALLPNPSKPIFAPLVLIPEQAQKSGTTIPLEEVEDKSVVNGLAALEFKQEPVRQFVPPTTKQSEITKPTANKMATILVTVRGAWADIWIDSSRVGRTGDGAIQVTPGTHQLRLENDFAIPYEKDFTVAPGENLNIAITEMQRKPAAILLPETIDGNCIASLDEQAMGTLNDLGYALTITAPNVDHRLLIQCTEDQQYAKIIQPIKPGATIPITFTP